MAEPSADIELGDPLYGSDVKAVTYEADEDINAGDVVALTDDLAHQADDTTDTNDVGIARTGGSDGDEIAVNIEGPVVANVATDVGSGVEVTLSGTDGQLAAGAGDYTTLTPEGGIGGLSYGAGMPDNAAGVNF